MPGAGAAALSPPMTTAAVTTARPIYLTREGSVFRLAYRFRPDLLERTKKLPYATFDGDTRTWTTLVCAQSVQALRGFYYEGLTDVPVDSLLADGEDPAPCRPAELRGGTRRRPFYVHLAMRGDNTFDRVRSIPGATWEKKAQALSFPPQAAAGLAELVDRGVLDDPSKLLMPASTVVAFDTRTGEFVVRGEDKRAAAAFGKFFPHTDVVAAWQAKGLEVGFLDDFTEEIYRGELARVGPGYQPEGLKADLFDFQKKNVAAALERTGFGIWDSPGLGKTIQGIAVGLELLNRGKVTRSIAVVPAAVRSQWVAEIVRFTGYDPDDVVVVKGDPKKRKRAYERAQTAKWFVIHYDVLSRDLKELKPLFNGALVIADEAHRLKSYKAQRTEAALTLCQTAARRLSLTGTPSERDVAEWYQVLSGFTVPGVLGPPKEFNQRYRYPARFGFEGSRNVPELRARSRVHYGRHTKEQVATHLPPLRVQQVILDPEPAYAAALRRAHREAAEEIKTAAKQRLARGFAGATLLDQDEADEVESGAEMTAVGQLRMLCSSPRLVTDSESAAAAALTSAGIVPDEDGPKLDELRVMLADMKAAQEQRKEQMTRDGLTEATPAMVHGERMVVFTFSRKMADLISERLTADGVSHVLFTGATSSDDRDEAVRAFTDPNSDVIAFVATDAAAEGLNLGRCCSTLVQFDLPWTPSKAIQRANRIHRLDGTAPRYLVINFVIANTMEIGVARLLGERAELSDALFGEAGGRYQATGRRSRGKSIFEVAMDEFAATGNATTSSRTAKKSKAAAQAPAAPVWQLEPPPDEDEPPPPDEECPPADEAPAPQPQSAELTTDPETEPATDLQVTNSSRADVSADDGGQLTLL